MTKSPNSENATLTIRVTQDWLDALDKWRDQQIVPPTRTQVVKVAVERLIAEQPKPAGVKAKRDI